MSSQSRAGQPPGGRRGGLTDMPESPPELLRLHRFLIGVGVFFFVYLIVEATLILPYMLVKFGWW